MVEICPPLVGTYLHLGEVSTVSEMNIGTYKGRDRFRGSSNWFGGLSGAFEGGGRLCHESRNMYRAEERGLGAPCKNQDWCLGWEDRVSMTCKGGAQLCVIHCRLTKTKNCPPPPSSTSESANRSVSALHDPRQRPDLLYLLRYSNSYNEIEFSNTVHC